MQNQLKIKNVLGHPHKIASLEWTHEGIWVPVKTGLLSTVTQSFQKDTLRQKSSSQTRIVHAMIQQKSSAICAKSLTWSAADVEAQNQMHRSMKRWSANTKYVFGKGRQACCLCIKHGDSIRQKEEEALNSTPCLTLNFHFDRLKLSSKTVRKFLFNES